MLFQRLFSPDQSDPRLSPLKSDELDAARQAARAVASAAQAGDADRRAARFAHLQSVLAEVRQRRGEHPVLWELEADFTSDPAVAADLYRCAEQVASEAFLPTLSIRLSLARLLFKELGSPAEARTALLRCRGELLDASAKQSAAWNELLAACEQSLGSLKRELASGRPGRPPDVERQQGGSVDAGGQDTVRGR